MKKIIRILIASIPLILIFNNLLLAQEVSWRKFIDKSFDKINIGGNYLVDVEKLYGKGSVTQMGSARCYYNKKEMIYVVFELCEDHIICGLIMSTDNIWKGDCGSSPISESPMTGKGVMLGRTFQEIIKLYGEPHSKNNENGEKIIKYQINRAHDPRAGFSYISVLKFKNNKLIQLSISVGP